MFFNARLGILKGHMQSEQLDGGECEESEAVKDCAQLPGVGEQTGL